MNPNSHHSDHHAPEPSYCDKSANIGLVLALGIMAAAGMALSVGIVCAAFYLKQVTNGAGGGVTSMLVLCLLSTALPVGIALKKAGTLDHSNHSH